MEAPAAVRVGYVRRAVGLQGELEVEPLGDNPARFRPGAELAVDGRPVRVAAAREAGGLVRLRLEGVADRDAAEALRGRYLEVGAEALPPLGEGAFYEWQLVGLQVVTAGGAPLGTLEEVLAYPANDVYRVAGPGGETLVPALRDVVREVDLGAGRMVVDLPPVEEAG